MTAPQCNTAHIPREQFCYSKGTGFINIKHLRRLPTRFSNRVLRQRSLIGSLTRFNYPVNPPHFNGLLTKIFTQVGFEKSQFFCTCEESAQSAVQLNQVFDSTAHA